MTYTANHPVAEQGKLRRALASVSSFLQAMEATPVDYTIDRLERLEREVKELKEELRQGRKTSLVESHDDSAAGLEP